MGSQSIQASLWGRRPGDWVSIQEATSIPVYRYVLDRLAPKLTDKLLDIGCGSGLFCSQALATGALVNGLDATPELIGQAKARTPGVPFLVGELEELPFPENAFDIVTAFNSLQYAANVENAIGEARRILKDDGHLVVAIWGNKEDCEAASYIRALGGLMPPPPAGAPGPFALTENRRLESLLEAARFTIVSSEDVPAIWEYPDTEVALRGLLSAGPAARAIGIAGYERAEEAVRNAMEPYIQPDGRVIYRNTFRTVIARK